MKVKGLFLTATVLAILFFIISCSRVQEKPIINDAASEKAASENHGTTAAVSESTVPNREVTAASQTGNNSAKETTAPGVTGPDLKKLLGLEIALP